MAYNLGADFRTRFITSVVIGPLALLVVYLGGPILLACVLVMSVLAAKEIQEMLFPQHVNVRLIVGGLVLVCIIALWMHVGYMILVALIALPLPLLLRTVPNKDHRATRYIGYLLLGGLYIGVAFGLFMVIRESAQGQGWILMLLVNNWATDGFALIGGRLYGKNKLAPQISPGKTVEGALTGYVVGFLFGMGVALIFELPMPLAIFINLCIPVAVTLGDLFESWVKRRFKVKDSGTLLPGHGGVLDRIDGTVLATYCVYLILLLVI